MDRVKLFIIMEESANGQFVEAVFFNQAEALQERDALNLRWNGTGSRFRVSQIYASDSQD